MRDSRTGLPPWVFDGKPPFGPWMKDSDRREPVICKPRDSLPRHTALLPPPPQRAPEHLKDRLPATVWVVHVQEQMKPDDDEPLEWFLLTTQEIATHEQAQECLRWYALRWRIEDWHRVLKTGCRVESLQHKNATRLKRALCVHLVIAWRIMLMTLLGRQSSELPAEILFTDIEIDVLTAYAKKKAPALVPGRLNDALRLVARLGGYIERGKQPPPGHQIIWRGYALLQTMCEAFSLLE